MNQVTIAKTATETATEMATKTRATGEMMVERIIVAIEILGIKGTVITAGRIGTTRGTSIRAIIIADRDIIETITITIETVTIIIDMIIVWDNVFIVGNHVTRCTNAQQKTIFVVSVALEDIGGLFVLEKMIT